MHSHQSREFPHIFVKSGFFPPFPDKIFLFIFFYIIPSVKSRLIIFFRCYFKIVLMMLTLLTMTDFSSLSPLLFRSPNPYFSTVRFECCFCFRDFPFQLPSIIMGFFLLVYWGCFPIPIGLFILLHLFNHMLAYMFSSGCHLLSDIHIHIFF